VVNRINGFWIPACAGMTEFLRFFTFFNTLLVVPYPEPKFVPLINAPAGYCTVNRAWILFPDCMGRKEQEYITMKAEIEAMRSELANREDEASRRLSAGRRAQLQEYRYQ
jgi:hypothetical protein